MGRKMLLPNTRRIGEPMKTESFWEKCVHFPFAQKADSPVEVYKKLCVHFLVSFKLLLILPLDGLAGNRLQKISKISVFIWIGHRKILS